MRGAFGLLLALLLSVQFVDAQGCRVKQDELVPVIDNLNPFFTDHTWDDDQKSETARLDPWRYLMIQQKGCLRHHIMLTMMIDKSQINNTNRFWVSEVVVMMKRVFFEDHEYSYFKKQFEQQFVKNFVATGVNKVFNFPVGERTFIVKIEHGEWGAKVRLEIVRFIIAEKVRYPGIDRNKDDGWFRGTN